MLRVTRGTIVVTLIAAVFVHADEPQPVSYPNSQLLIEPDQLAKSLEKMVVLDVRSQADYEKGHVPGAILINHDSWKDDFAEDADQLWSERIGAMGIDGNKPVVVYDNQSGKDAARIWWILRYWGVNDVRLLNGFWAGWQAAELPVQKEAVVAVATRFDAKKKRELLATKQQLLQSLKGVGGKLQIVDARSEGEHCGDVALKNKRSGKIPGAKHLDWEMVVDVKESQRFLPAEKLRNIFKDAGIDLKKPSAAHCQSGGRAAVMVFTMELMGAENVANYHNSFGEWAKDDAAPIEKVEKTKNKE